MNMKMKIINYRDETHRQLNLTKRNERLLIENSGNSLSHESEVKPEIFFLHRRRFAKKTPDVPLVFLIYLYNGWEFVYTLLISKCSWKQGAQSGAPEFSEELK